MLLDDWVNFGSTHILFHLFSCTAAGSQSKRLKCLSFVECKMCGKINCRPHIRRLVLLYAEFPADLVRSIFAASGLALLIAAQTIDNHRSVWWEGDVRTSMGCIITRQEVWGVYNSIPQRTETSRTTHSPLRSLIDRMRWSTCDVEDGINKKKRHPPLS